MADRDEAIKRATGYAADEAEQIAEDARKRNDGVISLQSASMRRTYGAKISRRRRLLADARNELIQRLRAGEAELESRLQNLERGRHVGFTIEEIGAGRLEVSSW